MYMKYVCENTEKQNIVSRNHLTLTYLTEIINGFSINTCIILEMCLTFYLKILLLLCTKNVPNVITIVHFIIVKK